MSAQVDELNERFQDLKRLTGMADLLLEKYPPTHSREILLSDIVKMLNDDPTSLAAEKEKSEALHSQVQDLSRELHLIRAELLEHEGLPNPRLTLVGRLGKYHLFKDRW